MWYRLVSRKAICLSFLYCALSLSALQSDVSRTLEYVPYFVTHYSSDFSGETGLPASDLNTVVQDRSGFLYFGSWGDGIFKFDGHSWTGYAKDNAGLNDNKVISMVYDDQDYIYIAHQNEGITRFNVQTCHGESLLAGSAFKQKISKIMYVPGDLLYICTVGGGGLFRYDITSADLDAINLTNLQKGRLDWKWNALRGLFRDSGGRIWVGSRLGAVILDKKGQAVECYFPYQDLRDQQVYQFFETDDHNILVLAEQFIGIVEEAAGTIVEYDIPPFTEKIKQYKLSDDRSLLKDRLGNYLLLTKGGCVVYDPRTGKVYPLTEANKFLSHNLINSGFIDEENNIWLTTQDGVTQLNVNPFKNITALEQIKLSNFNTTDPEYHLLSSNLGGVWLYCKSADLVFELKGEQYTRIDLSGISDVDRKLRNVFRSGGRVYYQIAGEYYYFEPAGGEFAKEDLISLEGAPDNDIKNVLLEKNGIRYSFYSRGKKDQGIMEYDPAENRTTYHLLKNMTIQLDFLKVKIYFFNRNRNQILIVNEADPDMCYLFDYKKKNYVYYSFNQQLETELGREIQIKHIKGTGDYQFWITTQIPEGMVFYYAADEFLNITPILGTDNITIEDIKIDKHDRLLLATATKGLYIYAKGVVKFFSTGEGLASNRLTGGIAIVPGSGEIYVNSIDAVSLFDETLVTARNLSVRFTEIRNGDIRLDLEPVILTGRDPAQLIELAPSFRTLDVYVAANTYASSKNMFYKFDLEGDEDNWSIEEAQHNNAVLYDLPPGRKQRLKVTVRDNLNRQGESVLLFRIKPFWYETGLFIGLMIFLSVALLIGIGILISVKRTEALQQKATELETLVNLRTVKLNQIQQELKVKVDELKELAQTDTLTNLSNRRHIMELLEDEFSTSQSTRSAFCIILGDIDNFKSINDQHGHDCGDKVLRTISEILKASIRKHDHASRWGGEEFLILLPDCNREIGIEIAEEIRRQVEDITVTYNKAKVSVTMSFGVAEFSFNEDGTCDAIIKRADDNLYIAKDLGRNRVVC